jgi:hypothetical protein
MSNAEIKDPAGDKILHEDEATPYFFTVTEMQIVHFVT